MPATGAARTPGPALHTPETRRRKASGVLSARGESRPDKTKPGTRPAAPWKSHEWLADEKPAASRYASQVQGIRVNAYGPEVAKLLVLAKMIPPHSREEAKPRMRCPLPQYSQCSLRGLRERRMRQSPPDSLLERASESRNWFWRLTRRPSGSEGSPPGLVAADSQHRWGVLRSPLVADFLGPRFAHNYCAGNKWPIPRGIGRPVEADYRRAERRGKMQRTRIRRDHTCARERAIPLILRVWWPSRSVCAGCGCGQTSSATDSSPGP